MRWLLPLFLTFMPDPSVPPPLRIRNPSGTFNQIPVFELEVSGGTLEKISPIRTRLIIDSGAGGTGAPTDAPYVTYSANATLSAERILTAGSSVTLVTDATAIYINALTGGGGTTVYAATGNQYVTISAAADLTDEYIIRASTGIALTSASNVLLVHYGSLLVTTSRSVATTYPLAGGGDFSADRTLTVDSAFFVNTGRILTTLYPLTGGGLNLSVDRTFSVDTAFLVTSARTLTAGSGLSGGGNLSADREFSINTNVRDKTAGFYAGGNVVGGHVAESARVRIPFNMEPIRVDISVTTAPTGTGMVVDLRQYNAGVAAGTSMFAVVADRPMIPATAFAGSATTFTAIATLYAGSFLGFVTTASGSTVAGSNLTVTVIARSS